MRFPVPIVCALAAVSLLADPSSVSAAAKPTKPLDPPESPVVVSIKVLTRATHVAKTVPRIVEEADRLWRPYGVRLVCEGGAHDRRVRIVIVDDPPGGVFEEEERERGASGLGWITFLEPTKPRDLIYLSWKRAVTLLEEARRMPVEQIPEALRREYLGRALGRTLAHEMGHYLLASTAHAEAGLMRRHYSATQLFEATAVGFGLDAERKRAIAAARLPCASPSNP